MKILDSRKRPLGEMPLDISALDPRTIEEMDAGVFSMPLSFTGDLDAINQIVYEAVFENEPDWQYPDPKESNFSLWVHTLDNGLNVQVCVEARPYRSYTDEDKCSMEQYTRSAYEGDEDNEDLEIALAYLQEAFEASKAFWGQSEPCGEFGFYSVDLSADEKAAFTWFLIQHFSFIAQGGQYMTDDEQEAYKRDRETRQGA